MILPIFFISVPVNITFSPNIFPSFSILLFKVRISPAVTPEFLFVYLSDVIVKYFSPYMVDVFITLSAFNVIFFPNKIPLLLKESNIFKFNISP